MCTFLHDVSFWKGVFSGLFSHLDGSHSWLEHTVHWAESAGKQPANVKVRTVCNIVCAINLQLIFLGHLSAGSCLHCSNLSAYYVTHWPTLPYTLMLSVIFHSAYVSMGYLWLQVKLTGFETGISQLKCSGCRWNAAEKRRVNVRDRLCPLSASVHIPFPAFTLFLWTALQRIPHRCKTEPLTLTTAPFLM